MILKEMPSYQVLTEKAKRYPNLDVLVTEAYLHVLRTGTILHHNVERRLSKLGLSYGRFLVLTLLSKEEGPVPVCKLAELAGVTTPTVSAVLSGLVRDGLVRRIEDQADRRVVRIELLPSAQKILDDVLPMLFENHHNVMGDFSKEELKTLVGLLSKVRLDTNYLGACEK